MLSNPSLASRLVSRTYMAFPYAVVISLVITSLIPLWPINTQQKLRTDTIFQTWVQILLEIFQIICVFYCAWTARWARFAILRLFYCSRQVQSSTAIVFERISNSILTHFFYLCWLMDVQCSPPLLVITLTEEYRYRNNGILLCYCWWIWYGKVRRLFGVSISDSLQVGTQERKIQK